MSVSFTAPSWERLPRLGSASITLHNTPGWTERSLVIEDDENDTLRLRTNTLSMISGIARDDLPKVRDLLIEACTQWGLE